MQLSEIILFVFLSFVVHRVTRFLMSDTLIQNQRIWLFKKIAGTPKFNPDGSYKPVAWRAKILELVQCWWCLSIWIAGATELVVWHYRSIPLPALFFMALSSGALLLSDLIKGS